MSTALRAGRSLVAKKEAATPDRGHELAFGTSMAAHSRRPEEAVALAPLAEQAGLDLATSQDHPYQPRLPDTWMLLSWVAAQTETLRVSPNVLSLPMRQQDLVVDRWGLLFPRLWPTKSNPLMG
jgi:hypothetical protein